MPSRRPSGAPHPLPADDVFSAPSSVSSSPPPSPSLRLSPSSSLSSLAASSSSTTASDSFQLRKGKNALHSRSHAESGLPKTSSEPVLFAARNFVVEDVYEEKSFRAGCQLSDSVCRRCVTSTDFDSVHGWPAQAAPDLLQLFSIFQFNKPEKPLARMLINVTLVGNIQPVRLLVAYDASVQDVICASLKAYAKEGRLPKNIIKVRSYGLHYSPFCLESIDPTEHISTLGTRSFFLFPSSTELTNPREGPAQMKPWWNIFRSMLS